MDNVSRPLIALLVGSVAFFALWLVALKPSSSSTGGTGTAAAGQYQSAIDKARKAVATSNAASVAHGGTVATTPTTPTTSSTHSPTATTAANQSATAAVANTRTTQTPTQRLSTVERALAQHKVLALLFYNPAATDDQAVKQELSAVPTSGGVVKLVVPISELSSYSVVANQVPVNLSPTLVLVDRSKHASEIAGFADRFEIAQRVSDALAVP